jgi:predicted DNA-binding protein
MNEKNKAVVSVYMEAEDVKLLDLLTRYTGRNRQYHLREALKRYLNTETKAIPTQFKQSILTN